MSSLTLTGCLYNWQLFQQAVQLMVREGVMAANTNEGFSQRHRPQNRSVKDGALAVIDLIFICSRLVRSVASSQFRTRCK